MGKMTTYMIMMSGLMLLFYFGGLLTVCFDDGLCEGTTVNSVLLNLLLKPERMKSLTLGIKVILTLQGALASLIIAVGIFIKDVRLAVMGSLAIYFFNLGWDFLAVFTVVREVAPVLAVLLFAPVLLVYVLTIVDWWMGRD